MADKGFREAIDRANAELGRLAFSTCYEIFLYGTAARPRFRPGVITALAALQARFPTALAWYKTNTMKLSKKVPTVAGQMAASYLESLEAKPPKLAGIRFHSGKDKDDSSVPAFELFSTIVPTEPADTRPSRTYVYMALPVDSIDAASLRDLCRTLVVELPVFAGHCGWSFYWSGVDPQEKNVLRANARGWLNRFQGLSYGDPLSFLEFIGDGVQAVSWLTYVEQSAVTGKGRTLKDVQNRAKKSGVEATILQDRVLELQASAAPTLCDRNRNEHLKGYDQVGRALSFLKLTAEQSKFLPIVGMDQQQRAEWYDHMFGGE